MKELVVQFALDDSGATAIEYALVASGISLAIFAVIGQISTSLEGVFTKVNDGF